MDRQDYSAQRELADDTPPSSRLRAAIFNSGWARVFAKSVELQLGLVTDLRGQGGVAGDVEVCAAGYFVLENAVARLHVANHARISHRLTGMVHLGGRKVFGSAKQPSPPPVSRSHPTFVHPCWPGALHPQSITATTSFCVRSY